MDSLAEYDGGEDIPNFIKLDQIPVNYEQKLETDLLEPVVFTQGGTDTDGFARFTLQNKGFLHSHSKIFCSLAPQTSGTRYFFAPHVGVGQVVKKAVLKIGNKTINEVDAWNALHAFKSSLITNENNKEREQYTTGRFMNNGFRYDTDSRTLAAVHGLDNGLEYTGKPGFGDLAVPDWALSEGAALEQCPSYSIDLSDLFPFLKTQQLPLYLMKEQISIELTFMPTVKSRAQLVSGDTTDQPVHIVRDELKFCADYIYYGTGQEMARFADANKDMSFTFVDYREIEQTVSTTTLASGVIRNLGMANRLVPRVIVTVPEATPKETTILGGLNALSPERDLAGKSGGVKYNIRYNDRFEFSSDIDNTARLFSMTTHAEGVPPFVGREQYAREGAAGGITTEDLEGRNQRNQLTGRFFYLSTRLSNGRVGQRGLEVHLSGGFPTGEPTLLRCFCEYVRIARIVDGYTEVFNA